MMNFNTLITHCVTPTPTFLESHLNLSKFILKLFRNSKHSIFTFLIIMTLPTQTDPGLVLPQGWHESEQALINSFFEQRVPKVANTTCTPSECNEFAKTLTHGKAIVLVNNQGYCSYTLACPDNNMIIQFRLEELNIKSIDEAKKTHGGLVSQVVYHSDFKLPVYTSEIIPGVAHCWQEPPRDPFPLQRELKTVSDLVKFIAKSSFFTHPRADCKEDSKTNRAYDTFERLEQNSSLKAVAPNVYADVISVKANLGLMEHLPLVLSHPDLVGLNIFVDRVTGRITGVIDFDGTHIEALGISIVTLYEWFIGSMEDGH